MSMECLICKMPTLSFHYKILSCRACAAFIRRTLNQKLEYHCGHDGNCDVTKDKRSMCRACRLKKCIALGMIDEADLTWKDRRESEISNNQGSELEDSSQDNFYSLKNVVGNTDTFFDDLWRRINTILAKEPDPSILLSGKSLCNQVIDAYANLVDKWPNCQNSKLKEGNAVRLTKLFCEYFQVMEQTAEMCMQLSCFVDLPVDQRKIIYRNFILYFPQMFRVFNNVDWLGHDVSDSTIVTHNGIHYDYRTQLIYDTSSEHLQQEMKKVFDTTTVTGHIFFYRPYKRLFADTFERAFLIARRIFLLEDVEGITEDTLQKASVLLNSLSDELHFYYAENKELKNYATRIYKINNLLFGLDIIKRVRMKNQVLAHVFGMLKINHYDWHNKDVN